uniref:Uncharacterized protein n=1 Tax=Leersia perrieri TaxID=77586 RepID=A0A0D9X1D5_9ORYZ
MAALVTSSLHPGHQLMEHDYGSGEGAHYCCNLCERVIFGAGYRCADDAKCGGFDIHKACLSLPMRITFNAHREHGDLTLSLLTAGRWCGICYVYSHAGCCRDVAKSVGKAALKVGFFGLRVADAVTGGFGSPVIDVVETALHL